MFITSPTPYLLTCDESSACIGVPSLQYITIVFITSPTPYLLTCDESDENFPVTKIYPYLYSTSYTCKMLNFIAGSSV